MTETRERILMLNQGSPVSLELLRDDGQYAMILEATNEALAGALLVYDQDGLVSCQHCSSAMDAFDLAYEEGYRTPAPGTFSELSRSERWARGMRKASRLATLAAMGPKAGQIMRAMGLRP